MIQSKTYNKSFIKIIKSTMGKNVLYILGTASIMAIGAFAGFAAFGAIGASFGVILGYIAGRSLIG